jgi:hypothetical protein
MADERENTNAPTQPEAGGRAPTAPQPPPAAEEYVGKVLAGRYQVLGQTPGAAT